ncbi:NAD-dependent epimerase/dehydratase family protein [Halomonas campaniensis]|uniref:NAD-dependent epimerase/dehydratase family protein n=1 Tax=Halomonas campaniensis TaxID=213554 RepID=UPI000B5359A3|nr:SDR family oxidoreductase [Halomonas campaniensis]
MHDLDVPPLPSSDAPKVLVTGAAGFIGAWTLRALLFEGYCPVVFDLQEDRRLVAAICGSDAANMLHWHTGDIRNMDQLQAAAMGTERIIHLAGMLTPGCRANPRLGAEVNLIGLLNVFAIAQTLHQKGVLYMSSAGVYGPSGGTIPQPTTLYGAFKLAGEICAQSFWNDDGIASIGVRPYVVYGPGREIGLSAAPSLAARAVAEGRSFTIPFTGLLDMIYVADVATAFVAALKADTAGAHVVNLFGQRIESVEVARLLNEQASEDITVTARGEPMPIVLPPPDDSAAILGDWSPTPLSEGLKKTIQYYQANAGVEA